MNANNTIKEFTDLYAWQKSHELVISVYIATKEFPKSENFGLVDQMRRAAVSITSNIAEGFGRQSMKEKMHFYSIAHGSLTELKNQLIIARDVNYIKTESFTDLMDKAASSQRLIRGLSQKTKSFI